MAGWGSGGGSGGGWGSAGAPAGGWGQESSSVPDTSGDAENTLQLARAEQALADSNKKSTGLFGELGHLASSVGGDIAKGVGGVLHVADKGRATLVAAGHNLGLEARVLTGREQPGDERPGWQTFKNDVGNSIGAGQIIQQADPNANIWLKRAGGLALDTGADPLNAVAPGRDAIANAGLKAAGQEIGDTAARTALRTGGLAGLRNAVQEGAGKKLEDVLARGTASGLGKKSTEDVVKERLAALDRQAKGGLRIGLPGHVVSTGIGASTADKIAAGIRSSDVLSAARHVLQPSAPVLEATDSAGNAAAFQTALHERGIAARTTSAALGDAAAATEEGKAQIAADARKAFTDALKEGAPGLVGGTKKAGFVPLAGATKAEPLVDASVKDAIAALAPGKAPGALGNLGQAVTDKVKAYTVFGPQNAIQHDAKRIVFNSLRGGTSGEDLKTVLSAAVPGVGSEAKTVYKAAQDIAKSGAELSPEEFMARGLDEQAAKRAAAIAPGIVKDNPLYEVGDATKKGALGTRTAAHVAERNGTINRLGVALNALDNGASPLDAVGQARKALLDFSNEGLTPAEKKLEKAVFFYKFPRRAIPAGVEFAAQHPGEAAALTRVGAGIGTGDRNKYGQVTHLMPDTPLEAAFGTLGEVATHPGAAVADNINPLLTYAAQAATGGSPKVAKALPPIGQAESLYGHLSSTQGLEHYAPKFVGLNPGEDYQASQTANKEATAEQKAQASAAQRQKAGLQPTKKDRLTALAVKQGVPNPYSSTESKLLMGLKKVGVSDTKILAALKG